MKYFAVGVLLCPLLSEAACSAGVCDETSFVQTKQAVHTGKERSDKVGESAKVEQPQQWGMGGGMPMGDMPMDDMGGMPMGGMGGMPMRGMHGMPMGDMGGMGGMPMGDMGGM